jgi:hypothetical protein
MDDTVTMVTTEATKGTMTSGRRVASTIDRVNFVTIVPSIVAFVVVRA